MRIDIILPTYNRCGLLARAVDSFLAAEAPDGVEATLVIVDNNSADGTKAVADGYAAEHPGRVMSLFESRRGKQFALNTGIGQSDADVIGLFDDDEVIAPDWLAVLSRNLADPDVDYVGGPVRPDWQAPKPDWFPPGYPGVLGLVDNGDQRRQYGSPGFEAMLPGCNAGIRRSVMERCGPYPPGYMYAEDRYMYMQLQRVGAVGFYDPALVVYHHVPAKRLKKAYYRHWAFTEGLTFGKIALESAEGGRTLLGAPPWMWRRAAESALGMAWRRGRAQRGRRFRGELHLAEFWGYLSARTFRRGERYVDRTSFT